MNSLITKSVLAAVAVFGMASAANAEDWKLGVRISAAEGGGVYVHEVFAGSPAEQAGLTAGMTILTADGTLYNDPFAFRNVVMSGTNPSIDLVYADGGRFYQVQAQFQVITTTTVMADAYGAKKEVKKNELKLKKVNRVEVVDPRGAKKVPLVKPTFTVPPGTKFEVLDPRKK